MNLSALTSWISVDPMGMFARSRQSATVDPTAGVDALESGTRVCVVGPGTHFLSAMTYCSFGLVTALCRKQHVSAILVRRLVPAHFYTRARADRRDPFQPETPPASGSRGRRGLVLGPWLARTHKAASKT